MKIIKNIGVIFLGLIVSLASTCYMIGKKIFDMLFKPTEKKEPEAKKEEKKTFRTVGKITYAGKDGYNKDTYVNVEIDEATGTITATNWK